MKKYAGLLLFAALSSSAATLEQYLSGPFASGLSAAPSGGKVAWVLDERGARNIWVAAAPDYKGRRLTAYNKDDGQDIAELAWTADGRSLLYTRGGDLDTYRDIPNPQSLAKWPEQAIYIIPFDRGAPKKLAEGNSPTVSKDGHVAFIRSGQIWLTTIEGENPEEIVHTKGRSQELRWSPDGTALVFISHRIEHAYAGVYRLADKSLTYPDPTTDLDSNPVWSMDGRHIAFVRQASGTGGGGAQPVREASTPWSIRIADALNGGGREIWHADKGPGSAFHAMVAENQILWADADRLVFPWEKDGWLHLYAVSAEGGTATLLTPGEFEIEDVSLARNRRDVLYSSNQDDIDRRHVWRVAVQGGGRPVPLLGAPRGGGIEYNPVETSDDAVVYFRSSPSETGRAAVKPANVGPRDLAPDSIPADYPKIKWSRRSR